MSDPRNFVRLDAFADQKRTGRKPPNRDIRPNCVAVGYPTVNLTQKPAKKGDLRSMIVGRNAMLLVLGHTY